jgi:hypothetical protein
MVRLMVAVWMTEPPVAVTLMAYDPAERLLGLRPLGSTPPLPQPLSRPRVVNAKSRVKTLQRRVERGRTRRNSPARATLTPEVTPVPGVRPRGVGLGVAEDWSPSAAGEMVRLVVSGVDPLGVTEVGVKRQTAPEGRPPVQAKVMAEWKPPVGVTVSVIGFEALPWTALVEAVEGDRVKAPAASRMVKVAEGEVLA